MEAGDVLPGVDPPTHANNKLAARHACAVVQEQAKSMPASFLQNCSDQSIALELEAWLEQNSIWCVILATAARA